MDPESPSFNRKPISKEIPRFDDANYWRLPIDELDIKETSLSPGRNFNSATNAVTGINGTLRGFKKPELPLRKSLVPRIYEIERTERVVERPVISPEFKITPTARTDFQSCIDERPLISTEFKITPTVQQDFRSCFDERLNSPEFKITPTVRQDEGLRADIEAPIGMMYDTEYSIHNEIEEQPSYRSFELSDALKAHPYRLFEENEIEVGNSPEIRQQRPFDESHRFVFATAADAPVRRSYRLFEEPEIFNETEAVISIPPVLTGTSKSSLKTPERRGHLVLSEEPSPPVAISSRPSLISRQLIDDRLLSPVVSNTTLGSKSPRESTLSKPDVPQKYDQEDIDYNKSTENTKKRFWFKWIMFWRSLIMTAHTWWTVYPGLNAPTVLSLGGKNLLISILAFSTLDFILAFVKAWPKKFWIFWKVEEWNPVKQLGNVWAILADHELLLSLVPMFGNLSLRVYSYRLTELVENPAALNSITNSTFTLSNWANPEYHNLVQLGLWGVSICASMMFNTGMRMKFFIVRYSSVSLGLLIGIKSLLLLFDMVTTALFLYTFLVSLGLDLFGNSPDIPLMLAIMISSPIISTISNSFINLPLLYAFKRIKGKKSAFEYAKDCAKSLFSIQTTSMSLLALFYIAVTGYLLNQLKLITADDTNSPADVLSLVQWTPQQVVVSLVIVNLTANYLIGVAFNLAYWVIRLSLYFVPELFG